MQLEEAKNAQFQQVTSLGFLRDSCQLAARLLVRISECAVYCIFLLFITCMHCIPCMDKRWHALLSRLLGSLHVQLSICLALSVCAHFCSLSAFLMPRPVPDHHTLLRLCSYCTRALCALQPELVPLASILLLLDTLLLCVCLPGPGSAEGRVPKTAADATNAASCVWHTCSRRIPAGILLVPSCNQSDIHLSSQRLGHGCASGLGGFSF